MIRTTTDKVETIRHLKPDDRPAFFMDFHPDKDGIHEYLLNEYIKVLAPYKK